MRALFELLVVPQRVGMRLVQQREPLRLGQLGARAVSRALFGLELDRRGGSLRRPLREADDVRIVCERDGLRVVLERAPMRRGELGARAVQRTMLGSGVGRAGVAVPVTMVGTHRRATALERGTDGCGTQRNRQRLTTLGKPLRVSATW